MPAPAQATAVSDVSVSITAPLSGNIFKVIAQPGQAVAEDDVVIIMEAMKMETEVRAVSAGVVSQLHVKEGDAVTAGQIIISLG